MQTSQAAISTPAKAIATPITMGSLKTFKTSVIVIQLLSTFAAVWCYNIATGQSSTSTGIPFATSNFHYYYEVSSVICHTMGWS